LTTDTGTQSFVDTSVASVMVRQVKTVEENTPLVECAKSMLDSKVGSLVITRNASPVGIFTDRDLVKVVAVGTKDAFPEVGQVMSTPLTTISLQATLMDAITLMGKLGIRHLLVVDAGRVAGMISAKDVFHLILSRQNLLLESVGDRFPARTREELRGIFNCLQDY